MSNNFKKLKPYVSQLQKGFKSNYTTACNLPVTAAFTLNHQVIRVVRHLAFAIPTREKQVAYRQ